MNTLACQYSLFFQLYGMSFFRPVTIRRGFIDAMMIQSARSTKSVLDSGSFDMFQREEYRK